MQTTDNSPLIIDIFQFNGQLMKQVQLTGSEQSIDVSGLPPGMYILHYIKQGQVFRNKFLKH